MSNLDHAREIWELVVIMLLWARVNRLSRRANNETNP